MGKVVLIVILLAVIAVQAIVISRLKSKYRRFKKEVDIERKKVDIERRVNYSHH